MYYTSNELYHHGIKGQKWGVRRYQNPDGTLTEEGKRRYGSALEGSKNPSNKGIIRRLATGDHPLGMKRLGDKREARLKNKIERFKEKGKDTDKLETKYNAQKQMNIDRDAYLSRTSTGKLIAQNIITGNPNAYRTSRSAGNSTVVSLVEQALPIPLGPILFNYKNTKLKYGANAWSAFDDDYVTT